MPAPPLSRCSRPRSRSTGRRWTQVLGRGLLVRAGVAAVGPGSRGAAGPGSTWGGVNRGTPRTPARPWLLNRADCVERMRRKRDKCVRLGAPSPPVWFSSLALRILLYLRVFKPLDSVLYYLTSPNNVERLLFCKERGPEPRFPARK